MSAEPNIRTLEPTCRFEYKPSPSGEAYRCARTQDEHGPKVRHDFQPSNEPQPREEWR